MIKKLSFWIIVIGLVVLWMVPFYSTVVTSFKSFDEVMYGNIWNLPKRILFTNFVDAWRMGRMSRYSFNTLIIVIPSLLGALFFSSLAAYALARYDFKGNRLILITFLGFNLLPPQIFLIPVFKLTDFLGIYNTWFALIIFHIAFNSGFCTFFLRNFMKTIPSEIIDAARIDGTSEFGIYARIALPLTIPAIAALGAMVFTWIWNDYIWAITILRSDNLKPITAGLAALQGRHVTNWPMQNAGTIIAVLPTILVFLYAQKYFVKGLTLGAGK